MSKKVSEFTEITSLDDNDLIPVVDVSASLQKKITKANLASAVGGSGAVTTHESTYDHTKLHNRQHAIDNPADHTGATGAVEGNIVVFDENGLPADSGVSPDDFGSGSVPGGTEDNFVSIASDETLKDSGKSAASFILHSLAVDANDFLVASGIGAFVKKTLAEVKTILGLGTAAYTAASDYAVAAKGVTNGDSHDHAGGDGAQVDHGGLGGLSDDDHTQYQKSSLLTTQGDIPYRNGSAWARLPIGTAGQFLMANGAGANPSWANAKGKINADTTYYIATTGNDTTGDGSSGNPWATIAKAINYLQSYLIDGANTVKISVADGTYTATSAILLNHLTGLQIKIAGQNTYQKTVNSVQSSSGGSGAWSIVLNMNSVENIAVNDYITIHGCAGGTYPTYLDGCHKVTNVDAVNTRITVLTAHINASAPSGAVTTTYAYVLKTILQFNGCDGFQLTQACAFGGIDKLAIIGNATASTSGIWAYNKSALMVSMGSKELGISNFAYGLMASNNALIYAPYISVSKTTWAMFAFPLGIIFVNYANITGNSIGTVGMQQAYIVGAFAIISGNTTGCYASAYAYTNMQSATFTGNGTDCNPTANTQGNEYGYIDT